MSFLFSWGVRLQNLFCVIPFARFQASFKRKSELAVLCCFSRLRDASLLRKFCTRRRTVLRRAKAGHFHQTKVVVPLRAKHLERSEAYSSKMKSREPSNLEREEKHDSFDVAASFIRCRSRRRTFLVYARASHWSKPPVALTALHGTADTKRR